MARSFGSKCSFDGCEQQAVNTRAFAIQAANKKDAWYWCLDHCSGHAGAGYLPSTAPGRFNFQGDGEKSTIASAQKEVKPKCAWTSCVKDATTLSTIHLRNQENTRGWNWDIRTCSEHSGPVFLPKADYAAPTTSSCAYTCCSAPGEFLGHLSIGAARVSVFTCSEHREHVMKHFDAIRGF